MKRDHWASLLWQRAGTFTWGSAGSLLLKTAPAVGIWRTPNAISTLRNSSRGITRRTVEDVTDSASMYPGSLRYQKDRAILRVSEVELPWGCALVVNRYS
jgi:hypothetical protein